ncbi:hypothetical protein EV360DRAFT_73745 [Lentinula raphanica]|nr:hypothetical protein EV360DRAFT_73745 [Lentinula raphanica]
MTRFVHRLGSFLVLGGISFGALAAPTSTSPSTEVQVLKSSDSWSSSGGLPSAVNVLKARGAVVSAVRDNVKVLTIQIDMLKLGRDLGVLGVSDFVSARQELLTGLEHPNELSPEQWQKIADRYRSILEKTERLKRLEQKPEYREFRDSITTCLRNVEQAQSDAADKANRAALVSMRQVFDHGSVIFSRSTANPAFSTGHDSASSSHDH